MPPHTPLLTPSRALTKAAPSDLARLLPLVEAYHAYEGLTTGPEARKAALATLLAEPRYGCVWFIEEDGVAIGYAALFIGYSIEFAGPDAFLDELYLIETARGRGVGRWALDQVAVEAGAMGVKALHLEVDAENTRAERLYRAAGYEARDRFRLMSLVLTPSDNMAP